MSEIKDLIVYVTSPDVLIQQMFIQKEGYKLIHFLTKDVDIVVFPGGADVNPSLYNEEACVGTVIDVMRDKREQDTWEKLQEKQYKNVLKVGICRGAQFLNVMNGGELWQDVKNHAIRGTHGVLDIILTRSMVQCTSTHHQMMIPNEEKKPVLMGAAWETNPSRPEEWTSGTKDRTPPVQDTEIVYYWDTHTYCFQPHPENVKPDHECHKMFFDHIDYVMDAYKKSLEEKKAG